MFDFPDEEEETERLRCPQCHGPVLIQRRYDTELNSNWSFKCTGFRRRGTGFCDKGLLGKKFISLEQLQLGVSFSEIQAMLLRQHWELLKLKGTFTHEE